MGSGRKTGKNGRGNLAPCTEAVLSSAELRKCCDSALIACLSTLAEGIAASLAVA